jgi:5-methylcytosine-specific restriction endonuclease McrA
MTTACSFKNLSDGDLLSEVKRLAQCERTATAALIASLAEMDARRLYLGEGCASLFVYCTRVLRLSEHAAYGRIEAARAAGRFPIVLERLERGELTLTNLCLLRPHLTEANCNERFDAARHASKRDVERLIATIAPRPDAPTVIRKLSTHSPADRDAQAMPARLDPAVSVTAPPTADAKVDPAVAARAAAVSPAASVAPAPARSAVPVTSPLSTERYKVQFTVGRDTHDKLRRAQDLLRHSIPDGDPAAIVDRALTLLLEHLERTKLAQAKAPRQTSRPLASGSRHIPASVRRAVWARDRGRCAFEGSEGRCSETAFLEFHHVVPFARGGVGTAENIELRCRAHNQHEALEEFGDRALFVREAPPAYVINSVRTEHEDTFKTGTLDPDWRRSSGGGTTRPQDLSTAAASPSRWGPARTPPLRAQRPERRVDGEPLAREVGDPHPRPHRQRRRSEDRSARSASGGVNGGGAARAPASRGGASLVHSLFPRRARCGLGRAGAPPSPPP